jgi:hypothetical protein
MSVQFEQLSSCLLERRRTPRFRFGILMPAVLGRGDSLILDISAEGARVMHFTGHPLGSDVRLVFFYAGRRFSVIARMLASRVIGLGNGPAGSTSYESRLQFTNCPDDTAETLEHIIEQIESERVRSWTSNAAGEAPAGGHSEDFADASYFMRCRLRGIRWVKCWTRDAAQPTDGFTVPAKLSDGEVEILCQAYENMDAEGRDLIRATATMAA